MNRFYLIIILSVVLLNGCASVIPKQFQGQFSAQDTGTRLTLSSNKGTYVTVDDIREAKASELKFNQLAEGQPGIYVQPNSANSEIYDVFWISPDLTTKNMAENLVWYQATIYYALFDKRRPVPVDSIKLAISGQGVVMLEPSTESWQIGWASGAEEISLARVTEK